jgi:hypothetical protein
MNDTCGCGCGKTLRKNALGVRRRNPQVTVATDQVLYAPGHRPCRACGNLISVKQRGNECCSRRCAQVLVQPDPCLISGCDRTSSSRGMCATHFQRLQRGGDMTAPIKSVAARGSGYVDSNGYRRIGNRKEHRIIMEQILGRSLLPTEEVHHKNGIRTDNRPDNLELWSRSQPPGQRVADQVQWAIEVLTRHAPHLIT